MIVGMYDIGSNDYCTINLNFKPSRGDIIVMNKEEFQITSVRYILCDDGSEQTDTEVYVRQINKEKV